MEYIRYLLVIVLAYFVPYAYTSTENSYSTLLFKKEQKPQFICKINRDANYLMTNYVTWEHLSSHGQSKVLTRLGCIEVGLEKIYNVFEQSTKHSAEFRLEFLQELDEDYGFLQCVLYNSNHEILQMQQVGVSIATTDAKQLTLEKKGTNDLYANQEMSDDNYIMQYKEKNISESSVKIQIILAKSEMINIPQIKADGNPPRFDKHLAVSIMRSKTPKLLEVNFRANPPPVAQWYLKCSSANLVKFTKNIKSTTTSSSITIHNIYSESSQCIIFVRIQNMFGVKESETVLNDHGANKTKLSQPGPPWVNFTLEMDPILGESVKLKCSTNIVVGKWLIYIGDKNMKRDLLFSNEALTNQYSDKKYNVTMNEWNPLKLEIKEYSFNDVTVYLCICSDEINKKNYQDQIDLRDYINFNMSDSDDNQRAHNQSNNSDGNDSSNNETTMWGIIIVIVVVLVLTVVFVVYKRLQYMSGRYLLDEVLEMTESRK